MSKNKLRLKNQPKPTEGKHLAISPDTVQLANYEYPIFCFKHLHRDYCLDQCIESEKISFVERVIKLSSMTWKEIQLAPRHGLGSEKIAKSSIKPGIPTSISEDITDFMAFRFDGKKPMVGFRNKFILHLVYIDRDFTLYKH